jgi:hydroxyacylglutathione hydrolase
MLLAARRGGAALAAASTAAFTTALGKATTLKMSSGDFGGSAAGMCCDVITVPTLEDNFAYILRDRETGAAACVDPAEPEKVLKVAGEKGLQIQALLCTHRHWDHSGGNAAMAKAVSSLHVLGGKEEQDMPAVTHPMGDGDEYRLGALTIKALHTPCHTMGHVIYFVSPSEGSKVTGAPVVFTGDTLFVGGCGKFFEGGAADMHRSLMEVVKSLPLVTRVFCGHEYTESNLDFALAVEPENAVLEAKRKWAASEVAQGRHTVPSTVAEELDTNPFMRVDLPAVQARTGTKGDPISTMAKLRQLKNNYRPGETIALPTL